ncbi:MAG TPA: aspartate-semialdehyde dehydrogenase [Candidatus Margulisiibacteriota bacterium]|nr:aspartate-semialdehyde dehydrogenase [Candidatus Margulisiibacteriota bacterium]
MKKRVAVVGATGIAGQQFLAALDRHPWFEVVLLAASERSAGKTYAAAIRDAKTGARRWWCSEEPPARILDLPVENADGLNVAGIDVVFTAVESDAARQLEPQYAKTTAVLSTASAFRYEDDVPIMVPGVNLSHAALIDRQRRARGWRGFIAPLPNCTTMGLVVTLKPLLDRFGLQRVVMTSMQGISGAGRSPGVVALDIVDNIIPYIPGEEEKVARETGKILGVIGEGGIAPAPIVVSATCTRAAVTEGHTEAVTVALGTRGTLEDVAAAFREFGGELTQLALPSAPQRLITVHDDPFRPQPRLDRDADGGMTTSVGRIRVDDALDNGIKYMLVSHNTKMGAAKGAVLTAEYLANAGYI